jgi:hypothetical protein
MSKENTTLFIDSIKSRKKPATFRLSEETLKDLENLSFLYGVSQAQVISVLVLLVSSSSYPDKQKLNEWFHIVKRA